MEGTTGPHTIYNNYLSFIEILKSKTILSLHLFKKTSRQKQINHKYESITQSVLSVSTIYSLCYLRYLQWKCYVEGTTGLHTICNNYLSFIGILKSKTISPLYLLKKKTKTKTDKITSMKALTNLCYL